MITHLKILTAISTRSCVSDVFFQENLIAWFPSNIKVNSLTNSQAKHSIRFDLYSFSNIWNSNIELNLIYIKRSTEPNNSHHRNLLETWIKQYLHLRIRHPDDIICHLLYIEILLLPSSAPAQTPTLIGGWVGYSLRWSSHPPTDLLGHPSCHPYKFKF